MNAADVLPIAVLVDREGLGDSLLKMPMLRGIRRTFPQNPVWWIATHQTSMARELAPFVAQDLAKVIEFAGLTSPVRDAIPRLKALPPFALVFDTRTRVGSVLAARRHLSHRGFYASLPAYLLSERRPAGLWRRPRGVAERALGMIEAAAGGPVEWRGTFETSAAAAALALERLPPGPAYVGLAPGSREARKNWPLDRFMALAVKLADRGLTPVFFIGPQEADWLEQLRAGVPSALFPEAEPIPAGSGIGGLERAIALGHRLAAAVANDSGIGHLLGSIGTPLVSLFGPTDPRRWAPLTTHGDIVRARNFGGEGIDRIPVDAVFEATLRVLSRAASAR